MSNLADKTANKALSIIAQMVKQFEKLHYLDMTKIDDSDAKQAEGIIHSNGYRINYKRSSKKPLYREQ
ncbi:hypothetical protein AS589_07870 [Empedobacter brevis]|uniref:hypothetical protein n=1 Tax=Empedobacter brevis TaxID=247 RepID=UPI00131F7E83|nr:hypothetical protein [Empedobacter brevis]QHC84709.1 hypothetical protein AS589_07870 [Empedobacter brevis]